MGGTLFALAQTTKVGSTGGQPNLMGYFFKGRSEQRTTTYLLCV